MSIAATTADPRLAGAEWMRTRIAALLHALVSVWIFSGGMVMAEPSPYELAFVLVLGVSMLSGFKLHRSTLGLLVLLGSFVPFAVIAAFQVRYSTVPEALIYQSVTIFLFFTAYWIANCVADAPQSRMRAVMGAYLAVALISRRAGNARLSRHRP